MANKGSIVATEELRDAAREFMQGFWDDPEAGSLARASLQRAWTAYKRKPHYEALRQRLSEATKRAYRPGR